MVKDDTLLLAGGVGLAAAFALGLFGKPEDIKIPTPTGIGFPDLSFLSDLFSFAGGVPDLGSSFFEGIAQQLAALQDQIGATGATIINIPQEFGEGVTDTLGDIGTGVSDLTDDVNDFVFSFTDAPKKIISGLTGDAFEGGIPFDFSAAALSGALGFLFGLPLGPAALITGPGAFIAGGFGARPLSTLIDVQNIPVIASKGIGTVAGFGMGPAFVVNRIGESLLKDAVSKVNVGSSGSRTAPPRSPSATISSPVKVCFKSFESFAAESRAGDLLKNAAGSFRFRG